MLRRSALIDIGQTVGDLAEDIGYDGVYYPHVDQFTRDYESARYRQGLSVVEVIAMRDQLSATAAGSFLDPDSRDYQHQLAEQELARTLMAELDRGLAALSEEVYVYDERGLKDANQLRDAMGLAPFPGPPPLMPAPRSPAASS